MLESYTNPAAMEPMLPAANRERLAGLAFEILQESGRLSGMVRSPWVYQEVVNLVRGMNCYYSNLIEGHRTSPRDIERAMARDFSDQPGERANQLLAFAHMEVERELEEMLEGGRDVYSTEFVCDIHRRFYERLPEEFQIARSVSGASYRIVPGSLRDFMVDVGRHTPPHFEALGAFLKRFRDVYSSLEFPGTECLVVVAAAHHRLAWIHPFGDGNGRVVRLHSQALLRHYGVAGLGLWTLSRGMARRRGDYYRYLEMADRERVNDFDGRGNLSDPGLGAFCVFFLETMLDQVRFMGGVLDVSQLRTRVERYFQYSEEENHRQAFASILRVLVDEGEIPRARVREITGKGATVAADIVKKGLEAGYFRSPSPKGVLRVAFPEKMREVLFPKLYFSAEYGGGDAAEGQIFKTYD
jgi:Fic family protein